MSIGTLIMIVCTVLYGLIVVLHKLFYHEENIDFLEDESIVDDPTLGFDGSLGGHGVCADDFDSLPPK